MDRCIEFAKLYADQENAALKEALAELIPMAKWYYGQYRDEKAKAAIDRAKKFIAENRE